MGLALGPRQEARATEGLGDVEEEGQTTRRERGQGGGVSVEKRRKR